MALTLPYDFDTTGVVRVILRGVWACSLWLSCPAFSIRSSSRTAWRLVQLLVIGSIVTVFKHLDGTDVCSSRVMAARPTLSLPGRHLAAGIAMGRNLAMVLDLPYLEEVAPY